MNEEELEKHRLAFRETFAKTGHETLRAMLVVSGGAAVAYLAFLGATFGEEDRFRTFGTEAAIALILAMRYYIFGVASVLLCYGFTWISHGSYYYYGIYEQYKYELAGNVTMAIAVIFGLVSLGFFVFGSLEAASAFGNAAQHISP